MTIKMWLQALFLLAIVGFLLFMTFGCTTSTRQLEREEMMFQMLIELQSRVEDVNERLSEVETELGICITSPRE